MSDKELTIDGLKKLWNTLFRLEREQYMDCVNDARELLEQSEPVRHGHWEFIGGYGYQYRCSKCFMCAPHQTNYCPACGCKMDEVRE